MLGNLITVVDTLDIPDLGIIQARDDGRVGGTLGSANEYGAFLAFFLPATIAMYWSLEGGKKVVAGLGSLLSGIALLMTVSRGAMVGLAVGSVIAAFVLRKVVPARVVLRAGVAAVIFVGVALIGGIAAGYGELLAERFSLFGGGGYEASSGRTVIWGRALANMLDHPQTLITGFGWYAYETSRNFGFATHNSYLNILYNLGLIGVALYLVVAVNILRTAKAAIYRRGISNDPLLAAFVFGYLSLLVSIFFGELHTAWLYIWAIIGLALRSAVPENPPPNQLPKRMET
jgi:O-antigen ligase